MNKDSYWFKHDSNASQDLKLKALRKRYGWQGSGWYWYLIETLRNETDYKLEYSDFTFDSLAEDMKVEVEQVKKFIDDCIEKLHLFSKDGNYFSSERLLRDMAFLDDKREKARSAGRISGEHRRAAAEPIDSDFATFIEEMRTAYPHLDINKELEGWKLYNQESKRKVLRPKSSFRNWLEKAGKYQNKPIVKSPKPAQQSFQRTYKGDYIDEATGMKVIDGSKSV